MHIKSVIIKGFKSFRDLESRNVEAFSPGHNVIVGRNGSGKSNFFHAIQFVLSDLYTNMRSEDRQHLIFDVGTSGDTIMQAYVEIVFDNKDGRFPIDKEEVTLRRTIGLKKDEYYLDKKHVTKHDVVNLLEAAGFSRSNPYYIVQQGRVNAIALMKDNERFELLKEVAGTRVYDERRAESEKIMQETGVKKEKVEQLLTYIEERLSELESEKEELKEYQTLDKDRRSLEFTIYDAELNQAVEKLARLEERRAADLERASKLHNDANTAHERLKAAERELKALVAELAGLQQEKEHLDDDRAESLKQQAKVQLEVDHARTELADKQKQRTQTEAEAARLRKEIARGERELEKLRKAADEASAREAEAKTQIAAAERRLQELYAKQGRKTQFRSAAERDRFLDQELTALRKSSGTCQTQVRELEAETERLRAAVLRDAEQIEAADVDGTREQHDAALRAANELRARRDDLANQRKELWRRDAVHADELKRAGDERSKLERTLANSVGKQLAQGLAAVRRIVQEHSIDGLYGTLLELCEVPERFMTAVEITAGNALFHLVVDTDETAARILEHLNEEKLGRVSFMPLNRLTAKEPPEIATTEAVPLLRQIKYSPLYHKAFLQVFGKTLVCRDLDVATKMSAQYNVNCVTLDGDQVNKSGGITGGYYDRRASRLAAQGAIREWQARIESTQKELDKVRRTVQKVDQEIAATLAEIEKQESRREQLKNTLEQLQLDIRAARQRIESTQAALEPKQRQLAELRTEKQRLEASVQSLQAERGTPLVDRLSAAETQELSDLTARVTDLQRRGLELAHQTSLADTRKAELELSLTSNWRKQLAQLETELSGGGLAADEQEARLAEAERQLAAVSGIDQRTAGRRAALDRQLEAGRTRLESQRARVDELKVRQAELQRAAAEDSRGAESALARRTALETQRDDAMRRIRDLGPLPADAAQRYQQRPHRELLRELLRVNERLKKYSHVNKKALDQFVHFTEQRVQLAARKQELDASEAEIRELIAVLDQRKDEAIERTFKGVARHFTEVFAELVPAGRASLVMQRKRAEEEAEDAAEPEPPAASAIRSWNGVAIRVAFNAQTDESRLIQQLSGGQKSLVALTFIFAIQRCDRAPFYLFDEIDSALDPQHRAAVARLIKKESEGPPQTQFITITFKPELVQTGDRFYVVRLDPRTKESTLVHIDSRDEARRVLDEEDRAAAAAARQQ